VTNLSAPWVDPANIPELMEIVRRRLLSKVRIFEARCEKSDRLLQVVEVRGRPLAFAQAMAISSTGSPNPAFRRSAHANHRSHLQAAWLDLTWDVYFARIWVRPEESQFLVTQHDSPGSGEWVLKPYQLNAQCQHEHLYVPLAWLRDQVNTGIRKRVITNETRFEMGHDSEAIKPL
jgi:hypothetical protein